jgi:hypothetical protein
MKLNLNSRIELTVWAARHASFVQRTVQPIGRTEASGRVVVARIAHLAGC